MEGGGEREKKSGPLELNWDTLLSDDEAPQEVIIREVTAEKSKPPVGVMAEKDEEESETDQYNRRLSDKEINEKIARLQRMSKMSLPDGGVKLRANLKKLLAELERRMRMKVNISKLLVMEKYISIC